MLCNYTKKNGTTCNNTVLKKSNFCYIKSHHNNINEYNKAIYEEKLDWVNQTYSIDLFLKYNVPKDGWCFYHSFGMAILDKFINKTDNEIINLFFNNKDFKIYIKNNDYGNKSFKEKLQYKLLLIAIKWLKENLNNVVDETKESIYDMVLDKKGIKYDNTDIKDKDFLDEYFNIDHDKIDLTENLPELYWGHLCEYYALSKYFKIDLLIFNPMRYSISKNEKKYKIMISKIVQKNITRYGIWSPFFSRTSCENSSILPFLRKISDNKTDINIFKSFSDKNQKKIINDLKNTIFLLSFISYDNDDEPHYNYLLFKENNYLKKTE